MFSLPALLSVAGRVPIWAWAVAALLAWGGWQSHRAGSVRASFDQAKSAAQAERAASAVEAANETARRERAQKEIADAQAQTIARLAADAAAATDAGRRLRERLAAFKAQRGAADPAAAGGSAPAAGAEPVLAELLGRCSEERRAIARFADASRAAGLACEASYVSLTGK